MSAVISAQITKADIAGDNENVPEVRHPGNRYVPAGGLDESQSFTLFRRREESGAETRLREGARLCDVAGCAEQEIAEGGGGGGEDPYIYSG